MAAVLKDVMPLVEMLRESEIRQIEVLRNLVQRLKDAPTDNDEVFAKLFALATEILKRTDAELAKDLSVVRPTIGRWVRGESRPHPLGRKSVFRVLQKLAEEDVRRLSPDRTSLARIRKVEYA
jgi:hypothetical protein